MIKNLLLINLLIFSVITYSQVDTTIAQQTIEVSSFNDSLLEQLLLNRINQRRHFLKIDELLLNPILKAASDDQVVFMSKYGEAEILQSGKMKTTAKRIAFYGGSEFGDEQVYKVSLKTGDKAESYAQVADEVAYKWLKRKKTSGTFENPIYIFSGISCGLNEDRTKLFISFVVGNYKSLKSGADHVSELKVPFSKKKYGLKPYDAKICKKVDAYKRLSVLQKGLYLEGENIYFENDTYKTFKKLMRGSNDGISVDVVQRDQYKCGGLNITDNSTPWKGILLKPLKSGKMQKKNIYKGKDQKTKLKVLAGKLPKGVGENIDFNLILIQEKHICADIIPNYIEDAALENSGKLDFLADTISTDTEVLYQPKAEESKLVFKVPFERNKFTYQESDIQPIVKSLNEPDFIINTIEINAFSSIEGDVESNKRLQQKRAESIEKALKSFISTHENIKNAKVNTDENWDLFKQDVLSTEYSEMANMSLNEAQAYIKEKKLDRKLEPILRNHRYAEIKLDITYDIVGEKEQAYVVSRFNKAVSASDRIKALSIQKYIFKKVLAGAYDKDAVNNQIIPESGMYAGLLMNKYWLQKYLKELSVDGDMCEKVQALYQLDNSNPYLFFNDVFCDVREANLADEKKVNQLRQRMDDLYETNLAEKTIDALNLQYLFGVIEAVDTVPETPELAKISLQKIKELVDVDEMNWKNALKLSYLFIEHHDFKFSAELLEPFLNDENVFEEILFTYISLATHSQVRINSNNFVKAIEKAAVSNPERLKTLFKSGRISPQVYENQKVKEIVCKILN